MTQAALDETCRTIYAETKSHYTAIAQTCRDLGFKILYGPPFLKPPILFIGYQPGGGAEDCARELIDGAHDGWPTVCEYATESWKLAYWMRKMFGAELLTRCVGLNAIFVRAPKVEIYRKTVASSVREEIEKFCLPRVEQLIGVMQPQRIVSIGFETLELFGGGDPDLQNDKGRTLTKIGKIAARDAFATLHLSGAQISTIDRGRISNRILMA